MRRTAREHWSDRSTGGMMRRRSWVWAWVLVLGTICSAAQRGGEGPPPGEQFLGTWTGTWEGAGSGGFELTLEKDKDKDKAGPVTGKVSVTGEPTYKAVFKSLS